MESEAGVAFDGAESETGAAFDGAESETGAVFDGAESETGAVFDGAEPETGAAFDGADGEGAVVDSGLGLLLAGFESEDFEFVGLDVSVCLIVPSIGMKMSSISELSS